MYRSRLLPDAVLLLLRRLLDGQEELEFRGKLILRVEAVGEIDAADAACFGNIIYLKYFGKLKMNRNLY